MKTLCAEHRLCVDCDRKCYPVPARKKVDCPNPKCSATFTLYRDKESRCERCKLRVVRGTRRKDGWTVEYETEEVRVKIGKKYATRTQQGEAYLLEPAKGRSKKRQIWKWIPDEMKGDVNAELYVWPLNGHNSPQRFVSAERYESSIQEGTMATQKKKKAKRKASGAGRKSTVNTQFVYRAVKINPHRKGSEMHRVYAGIKDGMTVEEFVKLAKGKRIIFYDFFNLGKIVVTAKKGKPSASTISRMRTAQSQGVSGKGKDHRRKAAAKKKKGAKK